MNIQLEEEKLEKAIGKLFHNEKKDLSFWIRFMNIHHKQTQKQSISRRNEKYLRSVRAVTYEDRLRNDPNRRAIGDKVGIQFYSANDTGLV